MTMCTKWILILTFLFSIRDISVTAYSNQWAAHIEGGVEVAKQVAKDHGFRFLTKVNDLASTTAKVCNFFKVSILENIGTGYFRSNLTQDVKSATGYTIQNLFNENESPVTHAAYQKLLTSSCNQEYKNLKAYSSIATENKFLKLKRREDTILSLKYYFISPEFAHKQCLWTDDCNPVHQHYMLANYDNCNGPDFSHSKNTSKYGKNKNRDNRKSCRQNPSILVNESQNTSWIFTPPPRSHPQLLINSRKEILYKLRKSSPTSKSYGEDFVTSSRVAFQKLVEYNDGLKLFLKEKDSLCQLSQKLNMQDCNCSETKTNECNGKRRTEVEKLNSGKTQQTRNSVIKKCKAINLNENKSEPLQIVKSSLKSSNTSTGNCEERKSCECKKERKNKLRKCSETWIFSAQPRSFPFVLKTPSKNRFFKSDPLKSINVFQHKKTKCNSQLDLRKKDPLKHLKLISSDKKVCKLCTISMNVFNKPKKLIKSRDTKIHNQNNLSGKENWVFTPSPLSYPVVWSDITKKNLNDSATLSMPISKCRARIIRGKQSYKSLSFTSLRKPNTNEDNCTASQMMKFGRCARNSQNDSINIKPNVASLKNELSKLPDNSKLELIKKCPGFYSNGIPKEKSIKPLDSNELKISPKYRALCDWKKQ